jgi:hypothetical protein
MAKHLYGLRRCLQCGYVWHPRVERPAQCPACKRYDYREPHKGGGRRPPRSAFEGLLSRVGLRGRKPGKVTRVSK